MEFTIISLDLYNAGLSMRIPSTDNGTDATLEQRDHPHGRRKGSAFAVLEASATHAGASKFWTLTTPAQNKRNPSRDDLRAAAAGRRAEAGNHLPSPPPRRRVEQKNGEETTPRVISYSLAAVATGCGGCGGGGGGGRFSLTTVTGQVAWLATNKHHHTERDRDAWMCLPLDGAEASVPDDEPVQGNPLRRLRQLLRRLAPEQHHRRLAAKQKPACLSENEVYWRGGALQGLAACQNQGVGRERNKLMLGTYNLSMPVSTTFEAPRRSGQPSRTVHRTHRHRPSSDPTAQTPPVISPDPEPLPRGGCGGCVAPPVPVAGASTLQTLQVQQLNFHFTCLASAALARHGNPREIGDSFDSRDHHESTTLLLSLDSMGAR
uniref:Uncharacterized protein n=1 Tax=Oryza rufipogon TaxID=4529 RepID=A0A0E0PI38_ORYRU